MASLKCSYIYDTGIKCSGCVMSAHRFAFPLYIGTVNKVKRFSAAGLIMEIGHEGVFPAILLHYHPLVAQRGDE